MKVSTLILLLFVGVVDSEDIPLNLSRELLQNSPLIRFVLLSIVNVLKLHTVCYIDLVRSVVLPFAGLLNLCR